ncbi:hypothetical protein FXO38_02447 [Capsicum annuum]|nr:hypothetical protein FXO38_02447 [Capsicum annuum]KAF3682344.1 hypothetical protein FXO37_02405 [Capsicum annuum]
MYMEKKNIVDEHTEKRTSLPRAVKVTGVKTLVFKPIQTRQETPSKKKKKVKQTTRVIFPSKQSKLESPVKEEAVSKPESPVEKEAFISKKVSDAFRDEIKTDSTLWGSPISHEKTRGHYAAVLAEIKKLGEIIPLCLQACNFYEKKGLPGGRLYFGGNTISSSMLVEIIQSSLCGKG